MAWKTKPVRFNLKLVRAVQKALARGEDCCGLTAASYHLFVMAPEAERPELYTISLVRDDEGTCMATCRELPEVLAFEDSEAKAIATAHAAIKDALAARGRHSASAHPPVSSVRSGRSAIHQAVA
jgi:hypothetical protein